MQDIVDTSAFILGKYQEFKHIKTTYQVICELDMLKENPRTRYRQIRALRDIQQLLDARKIEIVDVPDMYADESLLSILTEQDTLYTTDTQLHLKQKYKGFKSVLLYETRPENLLNQIKEVTVDSLDGDFIEIELDIPTFTYLLVTDGSNTRIGKYVDGKIEFIASQRFKVRSKQIQPLCMEQQMLVDQLFDDRISMVNAIGPAGSGKTFLSLQQQLHQVNSGHFQKLIVQVPPVQLSGHDRYGYLPGSLEEKTIAQFSGILDNIKFLMEDEGVQMVEKQIHGEEWQLEIQSFQNIRGRSIKNSIVIIDEQQNTHPHELKTFITRMDVGSKIILLGDIEQIDTNLLSNELNGLVYIQDKMYDSDVQTTILLTKTYRSRLVSEQIKRL